MQLITMPITRFQPISATRGYRERGNKKQPGTIEDGKNIGEATDIPEMPDKRHRH